MVETLRRSGETPNLLTEKVSGVMLFLCPIFFFADVCWWLCVVYYRQPSPAIHA